ncbi:hypothetical protein [Hymenobacter negativus]|uniref:Peptidase A2 domain-containing protein n=1 Tax=Hymenobacter negativus TaxID=2795026 RepID=A0ABS3QG57_9BACT|nr:hypothetical protein [Hymenobacter negativus]MBO2010235.1 hypothetical protein [Hymenobacter negativus]
MKPALKILLSVLTLFLLSGIGGYFYMRQKFTPAANQLVVSGLPATTSFTWWADTARGRAMPHAAVLVPVRLPGCPRTCYFQFDTGAPYSLLYTESLASLQAAYPTLPFAQAADTVRDFRCSLGQSQLLAHWVRVKPHGPHNLPADTATAFIIGTLGADVIDGRSLVLDFAHRRFSLDAHLPDSLAQRATFVPLAFENRRVLLTMNLQGKPRQLLYDSGTSAFSLLTSHGEWDRLAQPGAPVHKVDVKSFDRTLTSYTAPTAATLELDNTVPPLPLGTTTYMEGISLTQSMLMRFSGMGGMLGNRAFDEQTILLDVPGGRFGLVRRR